ncbi:MULTISPECIES: Occludin/ELL family protein [unclassified Synechococcus]|uniref:Occludin/ELL family protein n=2 Tax=unclassified Synechococcus TaxID=2626047 RepID=UPI002AD59E6C|nr:MULTISPECIES: Occludin/ELL family protein [unclassified Synechococcus]MEA5423918.1 Occludin/ELL family protein [Synechococcus sp. CCY9202]
MSAAATLMLPLMPAQAQTGPVVCTTTLEAPLAGSGPAGMNAAGPVEVTRCAVVQTTAELVENRFFTYTPTFARSIDITHQITDLFGIAMGGNGGTKVMGLGFPDQRIVWDASALHNTATELLGQQSSPLYWRTEDVPNGFSSSIGSGGAAVVPVDRPQRQWSPPPIRGLW